MRLLLILTISGVVFPSWICLATRSTAHEFKIEKESFTGVLPDGTEAKVVEVHPVRGVAFFIRSVPENNPKGVTIWMYFNPIAKRSIEPVALELAKDECKTSYDKEEGGGISRSCDGAGAKFLKSKNSNGVTIYRVQMTADLQKDGVEKEIKFTSSPILLLREGMVLVKGTPEKARTSLVNSIRLVE